MVAVLLAVLMLLVFIPVGRALDSDPAVNDTNSQLFAALVAAGKAHTNAHYYTIGELRGWTGELNLYGQGITNIEGLEYCTGITALNLSGNAMLNDLSPLDGEGSVPYSLKTLNLSGTHVSALPGDLQMPALTSMDLSHTPITDAGLAGISSGNLPKLATLDLSFCSALYNFTSIAGISSLTTLYLIGSALTDLPSDLSGMTHLQNLFLNGKLPAYIGDTLGTPMALAYMPHLTAITTLPKFVSANTDTVMLNISNSDITNASFLTSCMGLKMLMWEYCPELKNANAHFPSASNLYYLNLANDTTLDNAALTKIASLPCFGTHKDFVSTLCISATAITDVSNLSGASGLRTLYWQDMPTITSLTGLASLTQLTNVDLVNDMSLGDSALATVAALPNLNALGIGNCGITDLSALSTKTGITSLSIGLNKVKSLAPLGQMSGLNSILMNNDYVADLSPLSGKPITYIDCSQNYLDTTPGSTDMQVLSGLPATGSNKNYDSQYHIAIHYDADMAGVPAIPDGQVYYGQGFTPPSVTSADPAQSFLGWDADASDGTAHLDVQSGHATAVALDRPIYPTDAVPSNEITYTAIYGYNVHAAANNASYGTVTGMGAFQAGTIVTLHASPKTGYHFVRWTEGGSGISIAADYTITNITAAHTLIAEFAPNLYTVTFAPNGGTRTGGGALVQTVAYGSAAIAPVLSRPGYTFGGWDKTFGSITGNLTVTAKWNVIIVPVAVTCQKTDNVYYGAAKGILTLTASGGNSGAYQYSIDNGATWHNYRIFKKLTAGSYRIRARDASNRGNKSAALLVKILQPKLAWSNTADKMPAKAKTGTAWVVRPVPTPKGYTLKSTVFKSSSSATAYVDANGNVTFLKGGKVKITVAMTYQKTVNGKTTKEITTIARQITVTQLVTSITLPAKAAVGVNKTVKLSPVIKPSAAANKTLKWTTSDSTIAVVSAAGKVTGKKKGTATITCKAQDGSGVSAQCTVTVK